MAKVKEANGKELINSFDAFLFDADGVLWLGDEPLAGAPDFLKHLTKIGKKVFIVTNNSTKTMQEYVKKCKKLKFDMVPDEHILSPAKVLAHLLAKEKSDLPVFLVGSSGLQDELLNRGIISFGPGPDVPETYTKTNFILQVDVSRPVRAVVASYDIHLSYPKIMRAANYINQPGVHFYATNEDATLPGPIPGVVIPGAGVAVRAVQVAAGKMPTVIGKPSKAMFKYICERFNVIPEKSVMFGDRCETDIKFGHTNNLKSVLVGTGVHSLENVKEFEQQGRSDLIPTFFASSLGSLFKTL